MDHQTHAARQIDQLGPIGNDARHWMIDRYVTNPSWAAHVDVVIRTRQVIRAVQMGVVG